MHRCIPDEEMTLSHAPEIPFTKLVYFIVFQYFLDIRNMTKLNDIWKHELQTSEQCESYGNNMHRRPHAWDILALITDEYEDREHPRQRFSLR